MTTYTDHQNLIQKFKYLAKKEIPNLFLFDRHVGVFYTKRGTPVSISIPGMADVFGLYSNGTNLIHVEIEAKSGSAKQSPNQKRWQEFIEKNNGIYILIRSENDVYKLKSILEG